jgi:hypothetical protein
VPKGFLLSNLHSFFCSANPTRNLKQLGCLLAVWLYVVVAIKLILSTAIVGELVNGDEEDGLVCIEE